MKIHAMVALSMYSIAAAASPRATAAGQTVTIGRTALTLGMAADDAVRSLSREFVLRPNHGTFQTWSIMSVTTTPDTTYRYEGQIVAKNGRLTTVTKSLTPERRTSVSVGETFFALLTRIAGDGSDCRVAVTRTGVEAGPGAGGTLLLATLKCGQYSGSVTQFQGSDPSMSHEVEVSFTLSGKT